VIPSSRTLIASLAALAAVGACSVGSLGASAPSDPATVASTPPPDDTVTPDAVNDAGEKSSTAPYRLEMFMEASLMGMTIDGDTPLAFGEFAGEQSHMNMDFGVMFADMIPADEMPPELRGVDLVMEFITDGTDLYIRAPFFAALAELEDGGGDPTMEVFTQLGDGWGYVDGSAVPGVDATLSSTMGVGTADPEALFDLLSNAEGAEPIGTVDIRGVSTSGVRAEVDFAELMETQGLPASSDEGAPTGMTFPIEAWIDKDGFVRRIVMNLNGEAIAEAAAAAGEDIPTSMFGDMNMSVTMEMFDYNAADIVIEIPTEFTDITDDFAEIMPPAGS
jgi:hypothetical protein